MNAYGRGALCASHAALAAIYYNASRRQKTSRVQQLFAKWARDEWACAKHYADDPRFLLLAYKNASRNARIILQ